MASTTMIGGGRPVRGCTGCGQRDDHPRHVVDTGDPTVDVVWHKDCHANSGCESCAAELEGAKNATGAKLLDHILKNGA